MDKLGLRLVTVVVLAGAMPACKMNSQGDRSGQDSHRTEMAIGRKPGSLRENAKDGLKYVWIPPGTFDMGCSPRDLACGKNESPTHPVALSKGVWMGQTEVTVGAYKRFVKSSGRGMPDAPQFNNGWTNESMPMVNLSWDDANDYCTWADGRLPTEAEWEYAARGGSTETRYGNLDKIAWYDQNSGLATHEVAQKTANGFGLFDVLGNAWEWAGDWFDENYFQYSPSQDPIGPSHGTSHVLRGGAWYSSSELVRLSTRTTGDPARQEEGYGARCVLD